MINNLLEITWDNIIVESIGAFLGFLSALLLAIITSFIKRRVEISKIKKSLRIELNGILNDFKEKDHSLLSYSTPFWDSLLSTGLLLSFSVFPTKHTIKDFLRPLGEVYAEIKLLDELEKSVYLTTKEVTDEIKNKRTTIALQVENLKFMKNFMDKQRH